MESDTDSELDRRAYGQFASLAIDGDPDVDEAAVSYLRTVRDEAATLPDIIRADWNSSTLQARNHVVDEQALQNPDSPLSDSTVLSKVDVQASDDWIATFMTKFSHLRRDLQSMELAGHVEDAALGTGKVPAAEPAVYTGSNLCSAQCLSALLRSSPAEASLHFEESVDNFIQHGVVKMKDVHSIYCLAANLEYPVLADTEASMRRLLRHCVSLRPATRDATAHALLDILQVIAGAYFGQDSRLRLKYRQQNLHS